METHSSILAWRNPMDRGAWLAIVLESQRVSHNWAPQHSRARTRAHTHTHTHTHTHIQATLCIHVSIDIFMCAYICIYISRPKCIKITFQYFSLPAPHIFITFLYFSFLTEERQLEREIILWEANQMIEAPGNNLCWIFKNESNNKKLMNCELFSMARE